MLIMPLFTNDVSLVMWGVSTQISWPDRFGLGVICCANTTDGTIDLSTYATYLGPTRDYGEQVYCARLHSNATGQTAVMLKNADGSQGAGIQYATGTLPYFTLWKNTDTEADGYVTGLEPGTGYPYNRSVERVEGRVPKLAADQHVRFALDIEVLKDRAAVENFEQRVKSIQANRQPSVSQNPPRTEQEETPK